MAFDNSCENILYVWCARTRFHLFITGEVVYLCLSRTAQHTWYVFSQNLSTLSTTRRRMAENRLILKYLWTLIDTVKASLSGRQSRFNILVKKKENNKTQRPKTNNYTHACIDTYYTVHAINAPKTRLLKLHDLLCVCVFSNSLQKGNLY